MALFLCTWKTNHIVLILCLCLTDDGFGMVTGYIMEFDTIIVEVVEHSQTGLIPLSVVRLGSSSSETSCDVVNLSLGRTMKF